MNALLPSLLAGFATAFGSLIVLLGRRPGRRAISLLLGGAAGVMLAVILLDLVPAALQSGTPAETGLGLASGVAVLWILDRLINRGAAAQHSQSLAYRKLGYLISTGIALHDLPEGMAIAGAFAVSQGLGPLLALSIALHNIPEGIATAAPLELGGLRRRQVFLINLIISLFTPLGTVLGLFLLHLSPRHLCFMLALAAGAMTYLIKDELIPAAHHQSPPGCWLGLIGGYLLLWLAQTLHHL